MIKINNYSIKQLSEIYKIPAPTIYRWNQYDPHSVLDRIIKRRERDLAKISQKAKEKLISKSIEEAEKLCPRTIHEDKETKLDIIFVGFLVAIALFLIYAAW